MGDDLTFEQILAMLQGKYAGRAEEGGVMNGVGARGLDTPAERDAGLMNLATNYKNANATQSDYDAKMSYIDEDPSLPSTLGGLDRMKALQLRADAAGFDTPAQRNAFMTDPTANTTNLGMANPVLMPGRTPTIPEGVPTGMHRMPDGTMMSDSDMNYAGSGEPNMDAPVVDRQLFNKQFSALDNQEKSRVEEIMANMTDQQKRDFALGLTGAPLGGFAVQNEGRY